MKNLLIIIAAVFAMAITLEAGAAPSFSTGPGYMSWPLYSRAGDPVSWTSGIQSFDYDDAGNLYLFAENQYIIKNPDWSPQTLFDYSSSIWGSFLMVFGPNVYFGETTNHRIKSVPVSGGPVGDWFALTNNYDCAFNSQSQMFLSANPDWTGARIYYWNGVNIVEIADMGKYSGPIAFDRNDNLYYGFSDWPAGPENVVFFTATQVANAIATGTPLTSADWTVYAPGVDAPSGFALNRNSPVQGLFASSSTGKITRIYEQNGFDILGSGSSPSFLRFEEDGADFKPFTPDGGRLSSLCTDWVDYKSTIFAVEPCFQNLFMGAGDYQVDGRSEIAIFRPSTGLWVVRGVTRMYFGTEGDVPVSGDYDGDELAESAIFRPSSGLWALSGVSRIYFGTKGDIPLPRDYNNNGTNDIAVFRASSALWAMRNVSRIYFGTEGDFPVPEDYDGDGIPEVGIFRPSTGLWVLQGLSRIYFGSRGDLPVPGDYNGDGTVEVAIYRPSSGLWAIRNRSRLYFGARGDWPVPVDYEGDGTLEPAVFRAAKCLWVVRDITRLYFGSRGDFPASR